MNYTIKLAQPVYYYARNKEIKSNLRRNLVTFDELEVMSDAIEIIKSPLEKFEPFTSLIKVLEEDKPIFGEYSVKGYYIVGEFDLLALKKAVERRLIGKRMRHISFSNTPLSEAMESVAISFDDENILVEYGRSTKMIPRGVK